MSWKSIRLELACTPDFPQGSASRAYLLRLPLGEDGRIDAGAVSEAPGLATVRRFWPNEPDRRGQVVRTAAGWTFSYVVGESDAAPCCEFDPPRLVPGAQVILIEPDGSRLPFRVASMQDLGWNPRRPAPADPA